MPRKENTYGALIAAKQRESASASVVDALRKGTNLSMTLADFVAGVGGAPEIKAAAGDVALGDIFEGLVPLGGAATIRRKKVARRKARPKRRAVKKVRAKKTRKVRRKKAVKRGRADAETIAKRTDAIVAVLEKLGDWTKTGDIHALLAKRATFKGVERNLLSQYLVKLTGEKPARVKKKGQRGASVYRAASGAKKVKAKAKAKKRKTGKNGGVKAKVGKKAPKRTAKPKRNVGGKSAEANPEGG